MSIQKKSLISTLKNTKKANVASTSSSDAPVKGDKSVRLAAGSAGKGVFKTAAGRGVFKTAAGRNVFKTAGGRGPSKN